MKININELLEIFYKSILLREPDADGIKHHINDLTSIEKIEAKLYEFLYCDEFLDVFVKNKMQLNYALFTEKKPNFKSFETQDKFYVELFKCALKPQDNAYLNVHKRRFYNLNCMLVECLRQIKHPRLLEVGPSIATSVYKSSIGKLNLETIDRPIQLGGIDENAATKLGSSKHYNVDLNLHTINSSSEPLKNNEYDFILCTEVLEHLTVFPTEFIKGFMSLLKPSGYLYLTTPNFFSRSNCKLLFKQQNPQKLYPKSLDNQDAHYHHREYEMKELCKIFENSGGQIIYSYWSDCWDELNTEDQIPNCMLSNLVFLIKRADN
jgi:predicted SAM-dependent methyltransferase